MCEQGMQVMQLIKTAEGGGGCALIPSTATTGSCIDRACAMGQWTPLAIGVAIVGAAPAMADACRENSTVFFSSSDSSSRSLKPFQKFL
jgi:hypothetical protein